MKKLIAIILGIALLSPTPAQAQEPLTDGFGKLYPQYVMFDKSPKDMVLNYPSSGNVMPNNINLTILNPNLNISAAYFGLSEPCSTKFHGDFKKESFVLGFGPTTKKIYLSFLTQNHGFNCPELILNISITFNGQSISDATTQRIRIKTIYYRPTLEEQVNAKIEADRVAAELKAKQEAEAKAKAEAEAKVISDGMQNHINQINEITKAWEAATKALQENQRLQAEAKAKAEAEARSKAEAERILKNSQDFAKKTFTGKSCNKRNKKMIISEITFTCVKKGKRLSWQWN